uniref:Uncharacterized protein n=1 Tax=viral metagenome TaxID=1070528 RepID=A0A6M3JTA0_9ZZZZ
MIDIGNKYIHAEPIGDIKGKPAWAIVNTKSGNELSCINWNPSWKRYVMTTYDPVIFDVGCMKTIINFIERL